MAERSFLSRLRAAVAEASTRSRAQVRRDVERIARLKVRSARQAADLLVDARRTAADRSLCCWAIVRAGDASLVPELLFSFRGQPSRLTWEIAKALIAHGDRHIVPLMQAIAVNGRRPMERAAAAYVLGWRGDRDAGTRLVAAFQEEKSKIVRDHMLEAIGQLGGVGAAKVVTQGVRDSSFRVRASACYAAGHLGIRSVIPDLRKIVSSGRRPWEARAAGDALELLTGRKLARTLD